MRASSVLMPLTLILVVAGLSSGLLLHHFGKKLLAKKFFQKLRAGAPQDCELSWEKVTHPHCETVLQTECEAVTREECPTEKEERCKPVVERNCRLEEEEQCETEYRESCETVAVRQCELTEEEMCKTEEVNDCWEEDQEECSTRKECFTQPRIVCSEIFQWVCTKEDPPASPPPLLPPSLSNVISKPLKNLNKRSVQEGDYLMMFEKFEKLPTKDLLKLVDDMTEADLNDGTAEENTKVEKHMKRNKRSALLSIAGAIGISSLYNKFLSTQDNCFKKKMPDCAEVPVESCHDVQECETIKVPACKTVTVRKCWQEPDQKCWTEPKQNCWQEPEEKCWQVPREDCWDETVERCWMQFPEHCQQVVDQRCVDVPHQQCKDVEVKVARKYCKFTLQRLSCLKYITKWIRSLSVLVDLLCAIIAIASFSKISNFIPFEGSITLIVHAIISFGSKFFFLLGLKYNWRAFLVLSMGALCVLMVYLIISVIILHVNPLFYLLFFPSTFLLIMVINRWFLMGLEVLPTPSVNPEDGGIKVDLQDLPPRYEEVFEEEDKYLPSYEVAISLETVKAVSS